MKSATCAKCRGMEVFSNRYVSGWPNVPFEAQDRWIVMGAHEYHVGQIMGSRGVECRRCHKAGLYKLKVLFSFLYYLGVRTWISTGY